MFDVLQQRPGLKAGYPHDGEVKVSVELYWKKAIVE